MVFDVQPSPQNTPLTPGNQTRKYIAPQLVYPLHVFDVVYILHATICLIVRCFGLFYDICFQFHFAPLAIFSLLLSVSFCWTLSCQFVFFVWDPSN